MPYAQILQTISTACSVVGAICTVGALYLARRIHGTAKAIHQTVKDKG